MKKIIENIPTEFFVSDDGVCKSTSKAEVAKYEESVGIAAPKKITQVTVKNEHSVDGEQVWHIYDIKSQSDFIKMINEEVPDCKILTPKSKHIKEYQTATLPQDKIGIWGFCIDHFHSVGGSEKVYTDLSVLPARVLLQIFQQRHDEYEAYILSYANAIATLYYYKLSIRDKD